MCPSPTNASLRPASVPLGFIHGHQVGQHLAGVIHVGERIDHGDRSVACEIHYILLVVCPDHDPVQVPGEDQCCIVDGLSPPEHDIMGPQEQPVSPELVDPHVKGHPGAGGGFGEYHPQCLPRQQRVGDAPLGFILEAKREAQHLIYFIGRILGECEQMLLVEWLLGRVFY